MTTMTSLAGRIAVVTGAGTGIGRAVAQRLASEGAAVALLGRTVSALEETADGCTEKTLVQPVDVVDRAAVDAAFAQVAERLGAPSILVANAGIGGPDVLDGEDRWDAIVRTNLDGAYFCMRAFESVMGEAQADAYRHAVVISSCVARFGVPGIAAYSAAKAGQLGLVRSMAAEWAPARVLVNAICPGWVDTQMAVDRMQEMADEMQRPYEEVRAELLSQVPLDRISEPGEIAGLVAFLCSADGVAFTGQSFDPNNGAWMG